MVKTSFAIMAESDYLLVQIGVLNEGEREIGSK